MKHFKFKSLCDFCTYWSYKLKNDLFPIYATWNETLKKSCSSIHSPLLFSVLLVFQMCMITNFFCLFYRYGNFSLENAVQESWNLPDLCPKSMSSRVFLWSIDIYIVCSCRAYLPYRRDLNAASIVQSSSLLKGGHSHRDCWVVCFPVIPKGYKKITKPLN